MSDRITTCNMAAETGAKNAIIEPDQVTCDYLKEQGVHSDQMEIPRSDRDAIYSAVLEICVSDIQPLIAAPFRRVT